MFVAFDFIFCSTLLNAVYAGTMRNTEKRDTGLITVTFSVHKNVLNDTRLSGSSAGLLVVSSYKWAISLCPRPLGGGIKR